MLQLPEKILWQEALDWWWRSLSITTQRRLNAYGLYTRLQQAVPEGVDSLIGVNPNEVTLRQVTVITRREFVEMKGVGKVTRRYLARVLLFHNCETPENWHILEPSPL